MYPNRVVLPAWSISAMRWPSFSAANTDVHNIYAHLGARFLAPAEQYLWVRDGRSANFPGES
jgi:hypothetical protein